MPPRQTLIEIADVTIVTRTHEIPAACPKCGADFTDPDALRYHNLSAAMGHGQLEFGGAEGTAYVDTLDSSGDDDYPDQIALTDIECMGCEDQDWFDGENGWRLSGEYIEHTEAYV